VPEVPNEKIREHPAKGTEHLIARPDLGPLPPYAELQVASNFSFLRGASHPDELVAQAAALGCQAIAITDINTLAGVVRAHVAAKDVGMQFVVGCRVETTDHASLLLFPTCRASYGRLCRLLTRGKRRAPKGECHLTLDDVIELSEGMLAVVLPPENLDNEPPISGAPKGRPPVAQGASPGYMDDEDPSPEGTALNDSDNGNHHITAPPHANGAAPPGLGNHTTQLTQGSRPGLLAGAPLGLKPNDGGTPRFLDLLLTLKHTFTHDRLSLATSCLYGPDDQDRLDQLADISRRAGAPLVATNDVHYHVPRRRALQDVLTCIKHTTTIDKAGTLLFPHGERYIKGPLEMARLFGRYPQALARTVEIAKRAAAFSLDQLRYEYPQEICPPGTTPMAHLRDLTWRGAMARYSKPPDQRGMIEPGGAWKGEPIAAVHSAAPVSPALTKRGYSYIPNDVILRIEHEFQIIEELSYAKYFLTVYDIVKYARSLGILCQGRGAAANSAVCYCLGVTSVDPARIDLLFERFVSKERNEPPDIDIDFEHERREEVIQYIYQKYGRDRAALTCEVISYRGRSAVREVGKALSLSLDCVDRLAKQIDWWQKGPPQEQQIRDQGLDPSDPTIQQVGELTRELLGFPRHISQHVGGFVITQGLLEETVPIENAAMPNRTVIEWDKDDIDAMGMLKVDCLGLGMLTAIRKSFDLIQGREAETERFLSRSLGSDTKGVPIRDFVQGGSVSASRPALDSIPPEDPAIYEMIQHADTVGVFQIESRAQMSMLPRLKPENFYDLVIEVAIVRPGPIQGNMVHPYLRRRMKLEEPTYPNEAVKEVLKNTLGVPLFQEQAMKLAIVAAGFTPGEADQLRRAIAAWKRRPGLLETFGDRLVNGMLRNGYTREFADRCYEQIQGFSGYGFPESHAASFALLVYSSAWIKRRHPAAFCAGLLNSQPMGFYAPAQLVRDAREHGVTVRPIDVNISRWDCTLEPPPLEGRAGEGLANDPSRTIAQGSSPTSPQPSSQGGGSQTWGLHGPAIRLGMRLITGLREEHANLISDAVAAHGPFKTIRALWLKSQVPVACLRRLASADAFNSMGLSRRQALWEVRNLRDEKLPLFDGDGDCATGGSPASANAEDTRITDSIYERAPVSTAEEDWTPASPTGGQAASGTPAHDHTDPSPHLVPLPQLPPDRAVLQDYATTGLSLKAHPISFLREPLEAAKIIPNHWLKDPAHTPHGRRVAVAGIVLVRQRPGTASGIVFMTIEDETGIANLVIRPPIFEKYRKAARHSVCVATWGRVERVGEVVHVLIHRIEELSKVIKQSTGLSPMSRDFH
jgi:error-prone DNA polymerase